MDGGTDCGDVLLNRVLPLELGYVAVVNRGQRDINEGVGVPAALGAERAFFAAHEAYGPSSPKGPALASSLGTPALVARLSHTLHGCVAMVLPGLRRRVAALLQDASEERAALGEAVPERDLKRRCLDELGRFSQRLKDELDGTVNVLEIGGYGGSGEGEDGDSGLLGDRTGVAAITFVFDEVFASSIESIDALDGLSDAYIRRVIDNSNSLPPSLFVPEKAFVALVKEQIARLEQPGIQVCSIFSLRRLLCPVHRRQDHSLPAQPLVFSA